MQSFPHRGFDSDPGRDSTPDPVFPLRRQRSIARRVPRNWQASEGAYEQPVELYRRMPLAQAWPFEQEVDPATYGYDDDPEDDDDDAYAHGVPRAKRRGVRVTVVSTISSQPPMIADELRRQADVFIDLVELRSKLAREPSERLLSREPRNQAQL